MSTSFSPWIDSRRRLTWAPVSRIREPLLSVKCHLSQIPAASGPKHFAMWIRRAGSSRGQPACGAPRTPRLGGRCRRPRPVGGVAANQTVGRAASGASVGRAASGASVGRAGARATSHRSVVPPRVLPGPHGGTPATAADASMGLLRDDEPGDHAGREVVVHVAMEQPRAYVVGLHVERLHAHGQQLDHV